MREQIEDMLRDLVSRGGRVVYDEKADPPYPPDLLDEAARLRFVDHAPFHVDYDVVELAITRAGRTAVNAPPEPLWKRHPFALILAGLLLVAIAALIIDRLQKGLPVLPF